MWGARGRSAASPLVRAAGAWKCAQGVWTVGSRGVLEGGVRALGSLVSQAASAGGCGRRGWRCGCPRCAAATGGGRSLFIQTSETPNPDSMMFHPGKTVLDRERFGFSREFKAAREALVSPLAKRLFSVEGVKGVFLAENFITVTKDEDSQWAGLKPEIFAAVTDFYGSGAPVVVEDGSEQPDGGAVISEDDSEAVAMIKELLETRIRPSVAEDGGDITFKSFDEATGVVQLRLQGSCSTCPSSSVTLKNGVENMLKFYVSEVTSVEAVDDVIDDVSKKEFEKLEAKIDAQIAAASKEGADMMIPKRKPKA